MSKIILNETVVDNNTIRYSFLNSNALDGFFSGRTFKIEYPESLEDVPDSILAIPFVCNVLPIMWLTDSVLELDEIDKSFYDSISEFKKGYVNMYPNAEFKGTIKVKRIVENSYPDEGRVAMFYSGGLDSASTLVSHLDEKPILLSIWGSDIKYDNESGWNLVHSAITETSERFGLEEYVFRSTFREFDNEGALDKSFSKALGDGWWHGIKHSLALLGHVAPFVYKHRISRMYIAASNCTKYPPEPCASNPDVDNKVYFGSCRVIHDGYEFSRQDKVHQVVQFCAEKRTSINLHVCWENSTGYNCCQCEKCYRTMMAIWAENRDPCDFGFKRFQKTYVGFAHCFDKDVIGNYSHIRFFPEIQETALRNKMLLKKSKYYNKLRWYLNIDFSDISNVKMPMTFRIRTKLSELRFYQILHNIKVRVNKNG